MEYYRYVLDKGLSETDARFIFPEVIGCSPNLFKFLEEIIAISLIDETTLIEGEVGTGKNFYSEIIWRLSSRRMFPFVKIDCATASSEFWESELFGYIKGAYTGAYRTTRGKLAIADRGIVVFDNIEQVDSKCSSILIRLIDDKCYERLGSTMKFETNLRMIFISSVNLLCEVENNRFDKRLYDRINIAKIVPPTLKELRSDIKIIAMHYANEVLKCEITKQAIAKLEQYHWPGNITELFSIIKKGAIRSKNKITETDIIIDMGWGHNNNDINFNNFCLDFYMDNLEREIIIKALKKSLGIQAIAAKLLGIKERSLWHRIKKLGIAVERIKP